LPIFAKYYSVDDMKARPAGNVPNLGEEKNIKRIFVRKPEGKSPLGRPGCRWEDVIDF
jgi:hypothetical protein